MKNLPQELYRPILTEVDFSRDLCAASRACRSLQYEAERLLYRSFEIHEISETVQLCKRVCESPRIGSYVSSLQVNITLDEGYVSSSAVLRVLARSLERMVNLRDLDVDFASTEKSCAGLFRNCTFRLYSFTSSFAIDEHLLSFYSSQYSIEDIGIFSKTLQPDDIQIPPQILPKLHVITANKEASVLSLQLLHGWPVTHLDIADLSHLACDLTRSTGPIRALQTSSEMTITCPDFLLLPLVVPELEVFSGFALNDAEELDTFYSFLSHLRKLHTLDLYTYYYFGYNDHEAAIEFQLLQHMQSACPTLCRVKIFRGHGSDYGRVWELSERGWEWVHCWNTEQEGSTLYDLLVPR